MVFPACAGMFLVSESTLWLVRGFPRVRGDVPLLSCSAATGFEFSPRARGCSDRDLSDTR